MKKIALILSYYMLFILLTGCDAPDKRESLSDELGIDLSSTQWEKAEDSHEGFLGDGAAVYVLKYPDAKTPDDISESEGWRPLPMPKTLDAILYGDAETSGGGRQPLTDEDGHAMMPKIRNGYYFFADRHTESTDPKDDKPVLSRSSFNFTIAIFDSDTGRLYYLRLDT